VEAGQVIHALGLYGMTVSQQHDLFGTDMDMQDGRRVVGCTWHWLRLGMLHRCVSWCWKRAALCVAGGGGGGGGGDDGGGPASAGIRG
jgi:hypothetical protein